MTRELSLTLLTGAATLWALGMSVGGTWLIFHGVERWRLPAEASILGGVFWIAAGELLFMCLVADRWFPGAARAVTWPLEIASSLVLIGGVLWIGATVLGAWM